MNSTDLLLKGSTFSGFVSFIGDRHQISLRISRELINQLLFPLKSSENLWFSNDFRGYGNQSIRSNTLNIISEIWRQCLQ